MNQEIDFLISLISVESKRRMITQIAHNLQIFRLGLATMNLGGFLRYHLHLKERRRTKRNGPQIPIHPEDIERAGTVPRVVLKVTTEMITVVHGTEQPGKVADNGEVRTAKDVQKAMMVPTLRPLMLQMLFGIIVDKVVSVEGC